MEGDITARQLQRVNNDTATSSHCLMASFKEAASFQQAFLRDKSWP